MFFLTVFWAVPTLVHAHGVEGTVQEGGITLTALYDSGEPMSYAKVKIAAPRAELTFQSGRTDRNGRFCFFPDKAGEWEVVVDDEMGHRLEVKVPVDEQLAWKEVGKPEGSNETVVSRYGKALMGVCILFGLFGVFALAKSRKK
jgi:nickel transport protein